jgi:hypothetical protein
VLAARAISVFVSPAVYSLLKFFGLPFFQKRALAARAISVFVSLGAYSLLKFFELTFLSRKVSFIIRKVYVGMVFPERAKKIDEQSNCDKKLR